MKLSFVDSFPKSSSGSDHSRSHMIPCVGGSRNRSICSVHREGGEVSSFGLDEDAERGGRLWTYGSQIVEGDEFRGESSMDAKELLVHHRSERQVAERLHRGVVEVLRVLVLA